MDEIQPIMSPNIAPTPPAVPVTPSQGPMGLIIKIVVGIIVVAVVGTGAALATRIWDPLWNPFRPEPEEVIKEMVIKMKELKAVHSETKINLVAKENTKELFNFSVALETDSDNTDSENLKSAGDFNLNLSFEGMQFSLAGEAKVIGETFFVKLTTIPALPFLHPYLAMLGIDLSKIKNQWIKLNEESSGGFNKTGQPKEEQERLKEKLMELFKEKKIYYVKEELPDEKISGKKTYHYVLALDKEKINEVMPEMLRISAESVPIPISEESISKQAEGGLEAIDEFFEKVGEISGEVWIGKKDNYLYKVKMEKEIDTSKFKEGAKGKTTIKFEIELSNFDKPVRIEVPENFIGIEEVIPTMSFF